MPEAEDFTSRRIRLVLDLTDTCSRTCMINPICSRPPYSRDTILTTGHASSPGKNSAPSTVGFPPSSRGLLLAGAKEDITTSALSESYTSPSQPRPIRSPRGCFVPRLPSDNLVPRPQRLLTRTCTCTWREVRFNWNKNITTTVNHKEADLS